MNIEQADEKAIGRYRVRSRLGQGSMGQVYKVVVPGEGGFAALKLLKPHRDLVQKIGLNGLYDQFVREFNMAAELQHPHVVKVWGLEENNDQVYFLMEYFPRNLGVMMGESYFAESPSRMLRIEKAVKYALETLDGLSRLHRENIVHRDIKPFNLMLTAQDAVKITDFGLSNRRGETWAFPDGLVIGTPHYAAPEQIASPTTADHHADLYSVGVMLYRMLTGALPQKPFLAPSTLNPELDAGWDALMATSIHPVPEKRFADATAMGDAIQHQYQALKHQKAIACNLPADFMAQPVKKSEPATALVRSTAERVLAKHAAAIFEIDDRHRPQDYVENHFGPARDGVIVDAGIRLAWQQAGSASPLPWDAAEAYIRGLNRQKFGGYDHWRLPTVNELLSLLNPPPPGEDFCFQSPFSVVQKWLWSGDTRSKRAAWFVDMEMGFVASGDILDAYYVKAVCSL